MYVPTAAREPARASARSSTGKLSPRGGSPVGGSIRGGVGSLDGGVPATAGDTWETSVAVEVAPAGRPAAGVVGIGVLVAVAPPPTAVPAEVGVAATVVPVGVRSTAVEVAVPATLVSV
jgi:hypothetical protein